MTITVDAQSQFSDAVMRVFAPALRHVGFSRKGKTFYHQEQGNWGLVDFQKSTKSTADQVLFTVNLGVASTRLLRFYAGGQDVGTPALDQCHWRQRIGALLPHPEDKWWPIRAISVVDNLEEVSDLLMRSGIPAIRKNIADEQLRDMWLSGVSPGLTDIQRLMHLTVLLQAIGPAEQLDGILQELQRVSSGKPTALLVKSHIQQLREAGTKAPL
jgi:hypothetical protein